jgi:four helix bundle protein
MTKSTVAKEAPWERLKAWQACHELARAVVRSTLKWPQEEMMGLTSDVRQAAIATEVNICMGSTAGSSREFRSYLRASLGKLAVVSNYLLFAGDMGYLKKEELGELEILLDHATKLTDGLYRAVGKAAKNIKGQRSG